MAVPWLPLRGSVCRPSPSQTLIPTLVLIVETTRRSSTTSRTQNSRLCLGRRHKQRIFRSSSWIQGILRINDGLSMIGRLMPAVMELDASHETVAALQRLVPEAIVGGGSFASWLPHPRTLLPAERMTSFASAQESAVDKCVRGLLRRVGLREDTHVATAQAGNREWPPGLVGSLTDKGTVVLGVIVDIASVSMIGIDLERMDRSDLGAIEPLIAPEGLPSGMDPPLARLLVFSAKEAVFK